jgi:sucrose phosphorylase
MNLEKQIQDHLTFIYGPETATTVFEPLQTRLANFRRQHPELSQPAAPAKRLTEADSILITYGDQVQEPGKPTLASLAEVLDRYLKGLVSSIHILPFYPYSSDDGFSVVDYTAVDPALDDWDDVVRPGQRCLAKVKA